MFSMTFIMIGSAKPKALADFYAKVFGQAADWGEGDWWGFQAGDVEIVIGPHSEVKGKAKEPQRIILNFETKAVKEEFERIKGAGAKVVAEPYEEENSWIATFADVDGNYFQIMTPWGEPK